MKLSKKLVETFLFKKDAQLSNFYIFLFRFQSQKEHLLNQFINYTKPCIYFCEGMIQNIIDLYRQISNKQF